MHTQTRQRISTAQNWTWFVSPHFITLAIILKLLNQPKRAQCRGDNGEAAEEKQSFNHLMNHGPSISLEFAELLSRRMLREVAALRFRERWLAHTPYADVLGSPDSSNFNPSQIGEINMCRETTKKWLRRVLLSLCESPDAVVDALGHLRLLLDEWKESVLWTWRQRDVEHGSSVEIESHTIFGLRFRKVVLMLSKANFSNVVLLQEQISDYISIGRQRLQGIACQSKRKHLHSCARESANRLRYNATDASLNHQSAVPDYLTSRNAAIETRHIMQDDRASAFSHLLCLCDCILRNDVIGCRESMYRYFDYALSLSRPRAPMGDGEKHAVVPYAPLTLAAVHFRFRHSDCAELALAETVQIAQQRGDHQCVTYAMAWLHYSESNVSRQCNGNSIHESTRILPVNDGFTCPDHHILQLPSLQRPMCGSAPISSWSGQCDPRDDALNRCVTRVFRASSDGKNSTDVANAFQDVGAVVAIAAAQVATFNQVLDRRVPYSQMSANVHHAIADTLERSRSRLTHLRAGFTSRYQPGQQQHQHVWSWLRASILACCMPVEAHFSRIVSLNPAARDTVPEASTAGFEDRYTRWHDQRSVCGNFNTGVESCYRILRAFCLAGQRHATAAAVYELAGHPRLACLEESFLRWTVSLLKKAPLDLQNSHVKLRDIFHLNNYRQDNLRFAYSDGKCICEKGPASLVRRRATQLGLFNHTCLPLPILDSIIRSPSCSRCHEGYKRSTADWRAVSNAPPRLEFNCDAELNRQKMTHAQLPVSIKVVLEACFHGSRKRAGRRRLLCKCPAQIGSSNA